MSEFIMPTYTIVLTALMGYVVWLLKEQKAERKIDDAKQVAQANGIKTLLQIKLIEYHDRYMKEQSIPSYALQNFLMMYDAYHELGGNGMVTQMLADVKRLPIR